MCTVVGGSFVGAWASLMGALVSPSDRLMGMTYFLGL